MAFSYQVEYRYTDGSSYIVYAGNTEHKKYTALQTISAYGTIQLNITGSFWDSNSRLGLFKDALCTQAIDSDGGIYDGEWWVRVLDTNLDVAPGKTVYYGVILDGSSGPKTIPVTGKSLEIKSGQDYYQDIDLGTVTGTYP
jgi:hypothetical protein